VRKEAGTWHYEFRHHPQSAQGLCQHGRAGHPAGGFPFFAQNFGNSWVRIADMALLYIMLALGLNIVVGFAGLLDLGYIAFYAVGAYLAGLLASPQFATLLESIINQYPALGNRWWPCSVRRSSRTASTCRCG
jgi:hypothetical protein